MTHGHDGRLEVTDIDDQPGPLASRHEREDRRRSKAQRRDLFPSSPSQLLVP